MKISVNKIYESVIMVLLFLTGLYFKNTPQQYLIIAAFILIAYAVFGKFYFLPLEFYILAAAFTSYFFILKGSFTTLGTYQYIVCWLGPIIGFAIGYYLVKGKSDRYFVGQRAVTAFILGAALYAVLCMGYKMSNAGLYNSLFSEQRIYYTMYARYSLSIWDGKLVSPTNINSYVLFPILLTFYTFNYLRERKLKYVYIICFTVSIITIFVTVTRTNILILAISFVLGLYLCKGDYQFKLTRKQAIVVLIGIILVLLMSDRIISYVVSFADARQETLDNNRWNSIAQVLLALEQYPFGNMPYSYAHNIWVDVGREAGFIPMFLLFSYSIYSLIVSFIFIKTQEITQEYRVFFGLLSIGLFISFLFEPVIGGRPFNFIFYCMINGMIRAFMKDRYYEHDII